MREKGREGGSEEGREGAKKILLVKVSIIQPNIISYQDTTTTTAKQ